MDKWYIKGRIAEGSGDSQDFLEDNWLSITKGLKDAYSLSKNYVYRNLPLGNDVCDNVYCSVIYNSTRETLRCSLILFYEYRVEYYTTITNCIVKEYSLENLFTDHQVKSCRFQNNVGNALFKIKDMLMEK